MGNNNVTNAASDAKPMIAVGIVRALTVANLFAILLVIGIHYRSAKTSDGSSSNWDFLFQEFLLNGVARAAVPLFALLSGFFLAGNVGSIGGYRQVLAKKLRTLFVPYLLASALILVGVAVTSMLRGQVDNRYGSLYAVLRTLIARPASIQFWFLRDLVILTVLSPLLLNWRAPLLTIAGCLMVGTLWLFNIQPLPVVAEWYLINIETALFFMLGGVLYRHRTRLAALAEPSASSRLLILGSWLALIAIRISIDPTLDVWYVEKYSLASLLLYKMAICLGVVSLIQLSYPAGDYVSLVYLSGHAFFVFLFHYEPLSALVTAVSPSFYLAFPLATVLAFMLAELMSRLVAPGYLLLCGGRSPSKSMTRSAILARPT